MTGPAFELLDPAHAPLADNVPDLELMGSIAQTFAFEVPSASALGMPVEPCLHALPPVDHTLFSLVLDLEPQQSFLGGRMSYHGDFNGAAGLRTVARVYDTLEVRGRGECWVVHCWRMNPCCVCLLSPQSLMAHSPRARAGARRPGRPGEYSRIRASSP
jgi:hypothetical protein